MVKKYNYNQVKAYALIGFNNWNNSANRKDRSLNNFEIFLDPLEKVYEQTDVVKFSKALIRKEKKVK